MKREWPFLALEVLFLVVLLQSNAPEVWFWFIALLVLLGWRSLALRQRLIDRGKDSVEVIEERLRAAKEELTHADEFDYVIMNQEFATALRDLSQLVSQVVSTPA